MKLREINPEIERLLAEYNGEETTDERRLEIESALNDLDIALEEKAASYADLIAHYESDAESIKKEEQRLAAMRKRAEGSAGWLRRNLQGALLAGGKMKLDTDFWKFSFRRSEALIVRAEDTIPAEYMIEVPATFKPDNAKIKDVLKREFGGPKEFSGEFEVPEIPGVVLDIRQNLQIK